MRFSFYFIPIFLIFLTSCKKKSLPNQTDLEIGNLRGIKVTTHNDTFNYALKYPPVWSLDLNNDGEDDLNYWVSRTGTPAAGYAMVQSFEILNDELSFFGTPYDDSSFQHIDTSYTSSGGHVWKYMSKRYFFTRQSDSDMVIQNHYPFKIKAIAPSEIIRVSDTSSNFNPSWSNGSIWLINWNEDHQVGQSHSADTSYVYIDNMNINKYPYPLNRDIYFGFRLKDGGVFKLGWVKFKILNDSKARMIETAIQM